MQVVHLDAIHWQLRRTNKCPPADKVGLPLKYEHLLFSGRSVDIYEWIVFVDISSIVPAKPQKVPLNTRHTCSVQLYIFMH